MPRVLPVITTLSGVLDSLQYRLSPKRFNAAKNMPRPAPSAVGSQRGSSKISAVTNVSREHRLLMAAAAQGGWEEDETVEAAAARETVEEAGVRGRLEVSLLASLD